MSKRTIAARSDEDSLRAGEGTISPALGRISDFVRERRRAVAAPSARISPCVRFCGDQGERGYTTSKLTMSLRTKREPVAGELPCTTISTL